MTVVDDLHIPGWTDVTDVRPPDRRIAVAVGAAAVTTDLAVRSGVVGFAGALLVIVVAGGALASGRIENRRAWPVLALAPAFGLCLAVRMSPWLIPFDILAIAGLLVLAASLSREGDPTDITVPNFIGRALHGLTHGVLAPGFLLAFARVRRDAAPSGRPTAAVLRGLILAAPLVALVGLLLGSADPVFASFFRLPTDVDDLLGHGVLLAIGAWGAAGLLRLASAAPFTAPITTRKPLGAVESTTVLAGLVAVFSVFAASQVVAAVRGASYVARTAGLSYAEYARTGFFQLLAVAAITLAVLLAIRAATDLQSVGERVRFLVLSEAAVVLTIVVVMIAVRRLHLYEQAYGLTMLRLGSLLFALWIGAVFVLLGLSLAGLWADRAWLAPAAAALALAGLLVTNVVNPEALVVNRNIERFERTGKIDLYYLTTLSDDAVPAIADGLHRLDPASAAELKASLCAGQPRNTGGFWAYNGGRDGATEARSAACTPLEA